MSANAASLPCPICSHTGVFESVQSLRDRLISVSTNKILCPVCQEEVSGLDKLTIHLFSHVKLITLKLSSEKCENTDAKCKPKSENQVVIKAQQKKPRPSPAKNKSSAAVNTPVKFVKIYPKLPVISLNTVPVIDISRGHPVDECVQAGNPIYVPTVKTEASLIQTNTTCNVCGLQFVDANILRMHRCLIHNIDENSNQNVTRYNCHLCPKNFKMRGSLMVHLRVAHYGFSSSNIESQHTNSDKSCEEKNTDKVSDDKIVNLERNDNKQWQCDVCRKCFTTKYFLKKHKRLHTGETPYACTQCNKTFTFQQSYHKHLLYHNDEKPHTCSYCGRAFKELSTLHNHQRIHTGEKPFSCETCGKCFRQRVSYLVHRRIHTGVMPYKCTACDKSFRYKVSQRTHKCQAQPPGTVVRQSGDLVEKLKKKHSGSLLTGSQDNLYSNSSCSDSSNSTVKQNPKFPEISKANAELVLRGAKLSLEDMESENFTLLTESFSGNIDEEIPSTSYLPETGIYPSQKQGSNSEVPTTESGELFDSNIEDLIDSIPIAEKNIPSPSEILKNLCLSKEDDYIGILQDSDDTKNYDVSKDFNVFL